MISLPHYAKCIYVMHFSCNSINNVNNNQYYNCCRPANSFVNLYPIGSPDAQDLHH